MSYLRATLTALWARDRPLHTESQRPAPQPHARRVAAYLLDKIRT